MHHLKTNLFLTWACLRSIPYWPGWEFYFFPVHSAKLASFLFENRLTTFLFEALSVFPQFAWLKVNLNFVSQKFDIQFPSWETNRFKFIFFQSETFLGFRFAQIILAMSLFVFLRISFINWWEKELYLETLREIDWTKSERRLLVIEIRCSQTVKWVEKILFSIRSWKYNWNNFIFFIKERKLCVRDLTCVKLGGWLYLLCSEINDLGHQTKKEKKK